MPASSVTARRITVVVVCVLSLLICCGLAWWQWERFSSAGGTFQNLGYVLQWPLFGVFPAFMFLRVRQLNRRADQEAESGAAGPDDPGPNERRPDSVRPNSVRPNVPAQRPSFESPDTAGDDADDELAAYNRYLAELNAMDEGQPNKRMRKKGASRVQ